MCILERDLEIPICILLLGSAHIAAKASQTILAEVILSSLSSNSSITFNPARNPKHEYSISPKAMPFFSALGGSSVPSTMSQSCRSVNMAFTLRLQSKKLSPSFLRNSKAAAIANKIIQYINFEENLLSY